MEENKIKEQNRKAVAKYAKKTQSFALKYFATDIQEGMRLKTYIDNNNLSCNAYLKELVKRDLDNKGVAYPDIMDNDNNDLNND